MDRGTWSIVAAAVVVPPFVGYAAGWSGGGTEAPPAATTLAPGQAGPRSRQSALERLLRDLKVAATSPASDG